MKLELYKRTILDDSEFVIFEGRVYEKYDEFKLTLTKLNWIKKIK